MIYGKDHAIRKNTKAHVDVVEEVKRIEWISTRKLNMRDDVDDSVFLTCFIKASKTLNSSSRKRGRNDDSEEIRELKELTTLLIA